MRRGRVARASGCAKVSEQKEFGAKGEDFKRFTSGTWTPGGWIILLREVQGPLHLREHQGVHAKVKMDGRLAAAQGGGDHNSITLRQTRV
jgi:hypothetical protein